MKTKRKLIILEPECKSPSGHGLGSLEQYFNFFKDYNNVFCVTNNKLTKENFFNKKKIINSFTIYEEYFKIKKIIDFFFIVPRIFFFLKKCATLLFFIIKDKKIINFFDCFYFNKFKIPRYFPDIMQLKRKLNINNSDIFFIPSGRPAVMQALYFFIKIYPEYFPIVHFRIVHPIKWRGNKKDNFFKFQKFFLKNNNINKNFFFYAENNFYKKSIEKFYKINTVIFNGLNYIKKINKNSHKITVGFLGDSRKFKGFSKIPYLIENLQSKFDNIKFIIQINNPDKNLSSTIKKIFLLKKNFKNIKIYDGPIKNNTFNKILKKINIFPLLHNKNRAKTFGSGFIYTAIGSGICMVIPKGIENWKKVINGKSYLEAKNIDDYLKKISIMIKNYPSYLKAAIEAKNNYYKDLIKNPLITRIIDKNET